ncbi:Zinc finger C2CH-type [Trinorchestia longiramus]|nr:Zinc finger C2CH-type [Trinorchestia longiramus]
MLRNRMSDCNPKSIPCDPSANKLDVSSDSKNLCDPKLFREIVGSLIYLMTCTRPDICYVVTLLSQHSTRPTNAHLNLCKFVLKYLKGTILFGLKFVKSENPMQITSFSDSDWGGSSDRKSISGYVLKSSSSSSLISWKSKKQNIVALSSCEAEYIALTYAVQEGIFLKQLLCDMDGYDEPKVYFCTVTLCDDGRERVIGGWQPPDNHGDYQSIADHFAGPFQVGSSGFCTQQVVGYSLAILHLQSGQLAIQRNNSWFTATECGVVNCRGNYNKENRCRVYCLPKEQSERQKWLDVIPPRKNFVVDPDKFFICEIHWGADPPLIKLHGGSMRFEIRPSIFNVPAPCVSSPKPAPRPAKVENQQLRYFLQKDKITSFDAFKPDRNLQK